MTGLSHHTWPGFNLETVAVSSVAQDRICFEKSGWASEKDVCCDCWACKCRLVLAGW